MAPFLKFMPMAPPEPSVEPYIAMSPSTSCSQYIDSKLSRTSSTTSTTSTSPPEKPFVWRMQNESRKYQLFPRERQGGGKSLDPEQAFAMVMGQSPEKPTSCPNAATTATTEKVEKSSVSNGLKLRIREHNLNRRRKVSVPELGPMTTVQEVAMDSPTIPGRPAVHERSISAPGNAWKQHHLVECMTASPTQEEYDAKLKKSSVEGTPKHPLSPKTLAPLVIPTQNSSAIPLLKRHLSVSRLRSGSTPIDCPSTRRTDDSPATATSTTRSIFTPLLPLSASTTGPRSALMTPSSAMTTSTLPTPISAPAENRSSPKPWEKSSPTTTTTQTITTSGINSATSSGAASPDLTLRAGAEPKSAPPTGSNHPMGGHRRQVSDTVSIMDRGRPRKRPENNNGPLLKRNVSKRSRSAERRAFEQLPKGWKGEEAMNMLSPTEVNSIYKQAMGQASRFEILRKEDVDNLSRELRHLDERTEYLRRTYTSLRAGRKNLHARMCQYLRSPRTAKFSSESILKQEESLAELDASVDDWVQKLERAENRRTRVRQKLLEHVAAAAILPIGNVAGTSQSLQIAMGISSPPPGGMAISPGNLSTPPRSPTKIGGFQGVSSGGQSPSPQRVVAQVPSTIQEQPLVEEAAALTSIIPAAPRRQDVESIRIYADNDVYALLADVENEITKMTRSNGDLSTPAGAPPTFGLPPVPKLKIPAAIPESASPTTSTTPFPGTAPATATTPAVSSVIPQQFAPCCLPSATADFLSDDQHKEIHRARSHEMLHGSTGSSASTTPTSANSTTSQTLTPSSSASSLQMLPQSPPAPMPPAKDTPDHDGAFFLTAAVFKPAVAA